MSLPIPTAEENTPTGLTAYPEPTTPVSQSSEEPHELSPISDHPSNASPPEHLETLLRALPPLPPLPIHSNAGLKDLYTAIESFQQCYQDLQKHMDAIKSAILTNLETPQTAKIAPPSSPPKPKDPKPDVSDPPPIQQPESKSDLSELEGLCKTMCSRGIRKYLSTHLPNLPKVREEVPKALKLAPKPLKLVLECLGKFFLQGSKAYTKNSPMIPAREASIMILECYLLMDGANGVDDKGVKLDADKAAVAWRKRIVVEGGVAKANQIDARGLLLFVACFGIPDTFKRDDIRDLVTAAACSKEVVDALRMSRVLMNKVPEIVEGMLKNKMEVDAVNLIYTFGLEQRFSPQDILLSCLQEIKGSSKKPKRGPSASSSLNDANKKQLSSLRSIRRCLERHKVDPATLLPGWKIGEMIATLEKETSEADKKRKVVETEALKKPKIHDQKRPRYMNQNHVPNADDRRNLLSNHHHNNYPSSTPILYGGPGAGMLPESMIQSGVGPMHSSVQYGELRHGGVMSHGGNPNGYGWSRDLGINERYNHSSLGLYRSSSSVDGYGGMGMGNIPAVGVGSRVSEIYQYGGDSVEGGGTAAAASANPASAQYSSYLYQV